MAEKKHKQDDQQSTAAEECECPICQETTKNTKTTSCRHTFCVPCLDKWLAANHTCPMCRTQIQAITTMERPGLGLTFNHPASELLQIYGANFNMSRYWSGIGSLAYSS